MWRYARELLAGEMSHSVGIIGLGTMGARMLASMNEHPDFEVRYVWDLDVGRSREVAQRYPHIEVSSSAETLVSNHDLDLVYIATPPSTHAEYAKTAMRFQHPVLCEKPLAVDLNEGRELAEAANEYRVANAVNFSYASGPVYYALKDAVESGLVGDPVRVEMSFHFAQWPRDWQMGAAGWLAKRAQGGFVREVFSHFAFLTGHIVGLPTVTGSTVVYPSDPELSEIEVHADMQIGSAPVTMEGTVGQAGADHLEWVLHGTRRSYRITNWSVLEFGKEGSWRPVAMDRWATYPNQLDFVSNMVRGEEHWLPTFEAGLRVQEVVEAILR